MRSSSPLRPETEGSPGARFRWAPFLVLIGCVSVLLPACKDVGQAVPSSVTLTVTADPTSIPAESGSSAITVRALIDGRTPVEDGTVIILTTSLGTIDSPVETSAGVAVATLRSTGQAGVAVVTAVAGAATSASVQVSIGLSVETLSVTADPSLLPAGGGTSTITGLVLGRNTVPLAGQEIIFRTTAGALASGGIVQETDASGKVTDTLTAARTATVTASLSDNSLSSSVVVTVTESRIGGILLTANPSSIGAGGGTSSLVAYVWDVSNRALPDIPVIFSVAPAANGTLSSRDAVLTDSTGQAFNSVAVTGTVTVRVDAGPENVEVAVTVGETSAGWVLTLTPIMTYLNTPSIPPVGSECSPSGELPVALTAHLSDASGNPVPDETVLFQIITDNDTTTNDLYGGFCPTLATTFSTDTDAAGDAFAQFSYPSGQLTICRNLTSNFCRTYIRASVGTLNSTNDVTVTEVH
jgi:hypothetical protein